MTPEEQAQQALTLYPALEEVMLRLDAAARAAVLQAIVVTIRAVQHEERRVCAKIALDQLQSASAGRCQAIIEGIAAAILARDVEQETAP